ncbi:hypothetical protein BofuT4_uP136040.1 [Botrytis cinerea T4]|uniref:Uncharacterized protein n=1 Tax=Botryotinia fuckeliana (strain T4) TaxID=999810 RepID=G2YPL1_BOTF4|nr:hypothetical protein BofuT4_uP136040.1 [Botrytis cinerea T4]
METCPEYQFHTIKACREPSYRVVWGAVRCDAVWFCGWMSTEMDG